MSKIYVREFGADQRDGPYSCDQFKCRMVLLEVADAGYIGFDPRLSRGPTHIKTEKVAGKSIPCVEDGHHKDNNGCGARGRRYAKRGNTTHGALPVTRAVTPRIQHAAVLKIVRKGPNRASDA